MRCVLSQNTINKDFIQFVKQNATQLGLVDLVKNNAFINDKMRNGTKEEVIEILKKPDLSSKIVAIVESSLIQTYHLLMDTMDKDCDKVAFGIQDFKKALTYGAIDTTLVTEGFLEQLGNQRREGFIRALNNLVNTGSKVVIYPKKSTNYKGIEALSGLAFTLRFKIN